MKPTESPAAVDWTRAKSLLEDLKSTARRTLAIQCLEGGELYALKSKLGFVNGRNQWVGHNVQPSRTWEQCCQEELGIERRTADRWISCFHAAVDRAKRQKAKCPEAIMLLEADPATMDKAHLALLSDHVHRLVDGETQAGLLIELGIVKKANTLTGGDTSQFKKSFSEMAADAWAEKFFAGIARTLDKVRSEILRTRDGVDYRFRLKELPLAPDPDDQERPCLQGIKLTLEEILQGDLVKVIRDVDAEIAARMEPVAVKRPRKTSTKSKR